MTVDTSREDESHTGFVVHVGADYCVLTRLFQQCWRNGFRAFRLDKIEDVDLAEEVDFLSVDFLRRSRIARNEHQPVSLAFHADTFSEFIANVTTHYGVAIMNGETPSGKSFGFAATVIAVTAEKFLARLFTTDGYWESPEQQVPFSEIYEVCFNSEYERTLTAMGKLDDAWSRASD